MPAQVTPEKRAQFLGFLAETANVSKSAELAGLDRRDVYEARKKDPEFATQWQEALDIGVEACEDEMRRRAYGGVDEPLHKDGIPTGYFVKKYSDTLAIFLMKGHKPDKYRERTSSEISGPGGKPIEIKDESEAVDRLAKILGAGKLRFENGDDLA